MAMLNNQMVESIDHLTSQIGMVPTDMEQKVLAGNSLHPCSTTPETDLFPRFG